MMQSCYVSYGRISIFKRLFPMHKENTIVSFGDNVSIRSSPETENIGIAGLSGHVCGETTPSVIDVEVIGICETDYAINVFVEELQKSFWLSPALVEFVDHAAGTEISIAGVNKKWVRSENGEWVEQNQKAWWKFWQ